MLRIFTRLAVGTWLPCMWCALGMAALGTLLPFAPDALFAMCDLPCFGGITPGRTAYAGVVQRLNEHFGDVQIETPSVQANVPPPLVFYATLDTRAIEGTITGLEHVRTLTVRLDTPLMVLLDELGTPDCLLHDRIIDGIQTFMIVQWRGPVTVSAYLEISGANPWGPFSRVGSLRLSVADSGCRGGRFMVRRWPGFAALWRLAAASSDVGTR
ncbi:MAG: hypothetical protein HXY40_10755 [Chloroflexi bacterium]|nr:hypothetical protein [Chloroflexota bacterium]